MPMDKTKIANLALAEIPHEPIDDYNEDSKPAREIRRHYLNVVRELMQLSEWSFFSRRRELDEMEENDRSAEWGYAYELPSGIGRLWRIIPGQSEADTPSVGLPFGDYDARSPLYEYTISGDAIYTDLAGAWAVFTDNTYDPDEEKVPPIWVKALYTELAARVALALNGDRQMRLELEQRAELYRQRALADDLNRRSPRTVNPVPEALLVR